MILLLLFFPASIFALPPSADPLPNIGPFPCYSSIPLPDVNIVTGENSDCGGPVTVNFLNDSPDPGCSGTVVRTYQLQDTCGATTNITQNIFIDDDTAPVILSCPADITASCPQNIPPPNPASVTWFDNCGPATVTYMGDDTLAGYMQNGDYCTAYLTRTYRVTDPCGNFTECDQIIQIQDACDPGYECPVCEDIVPHFDVDFTNDPTATWTSPSVARDGRCCAQLGPPPPNCIHFTIVLPPSVVAITFNIESGALPSGSLFYQIDCNEVHQVGDTICLLGNATYELTFCKPGNNENVYSITAFGADIIPDTIQAQVSCSKEIVVEGIVESSAVWNDITGGGQYNSYLSCLSGCLSTTFTPDSNAPAFIMYQVCGDRGSLICGETSIVCDTVVAVVHPEIIASVNPNPAVYCSDEIGTLTGSVIPAGSYAMQWFNGPNGTGSLVGTGSTFNPSSSGTYSFIVTELSNTLNCKYDTVNVPVTIVPLPQFDLGNDTSVCSSATVYFNLPAGPDYTWNPQTGVTQGNDPGEFIVTGSNSITYTVNAVTPEGCEWTDAWALNVVNCTIDCPEQSHCSVNDIVVYQTVTEFINAGGSITLPCTIPQNNITLVASASNGLSCPETITHTYSIEDACGNIDSCDVVITINDLEPPVWTSTPSPIGPWSCTDSIPAHETLTATDNCSAIITTSIDPYEVDLCNGYDITLRWMLEDSCGNSAPDQTLVVNILPPEPPVFTNAPPVNVIMTCGELSGFSIPDLAYDNGQSGSCEIAGTVPGTINGTPDACGGSFTIEWTYTDTCGRTINHTQTVTIEENLPPLITCPPNQDAECAADIQPPFTSYADFIAGGGIITDDCGIMESSFTINESENGICPRIITRTYSIADSCGNTAQCVQTITVNDQENPVITCPSNETLECGGNIPPAFSGYNDFINGGGSVSDNCLINESSFTVTESVSGNCPRIITRIYTIADSCGNSAQCVQTITITDQVAPVISCPGNLTLDCFGEIPPSSNTLNEFLNNGGSVSDNCALDLSTFNFTESISGICPKTITRTYSIADSCGNSAQCIQTITVDDQQPPNITCPGNLNLECSGDVPPPLATYTDFISGGGSAMDNCELVLSSFTFTETDNGTCPRTITHTYTIADSCGNTSQCVQTITVIDQEPPVLTCPGDLALECSGDIPPAFTSYTAFIAAGGSASDNCELVESSFSVTETDNGTCPRTITRNYSIGDSCGNSTQCVQSITIDDQSPPILTCPSNMVAECSGDIPAAFTTYTAFIAGGGSASDNCELDESTFFVTETDNGNCPRIITRTYSIADSCGNLAECTQLITLDDPTPPAITCPPDLVIDCDGNIPLLPANYNEFINAGGSVADNCGVNESSFSVTESDNGTCPRVITRTFTIADSCGNTGQCIQSITIHDPVSPQITCPEDQEFECAGEIDPVPTTFEEFINNGGSVFENCAINESSFEAIETITGVCPRTYTRTFTIADSCGNTGQCIQTITITDQQDPTIQCPPDFDFECSGDIPAPFQNFTEFINGGGSASDNCSLDESTFSVEESDNGTCPRTIVRTYSIQDSCGNIGSCVQTFTVNDQQDPIISCPAELSLECSGEIPPAYSNFGEFINAGGSASDNCSLNEQSFSFNETDNGICPRIITRTYSIEDSCGNFGQCIQIIMISDNIPPTATNPAPIQIECSGEVPEPDISLIQASDNCSQPIIEFVSDMSDGASCPETITRTYRITDECNNEVFVTQVITIGDAEPPTATNPAPIVIECTGQVPDPDPTQIQASDNCSVPLVEFISDMSDGNTCPEVITRTYRISDECENEIFITQIITVGDNQPPTASELPPLTIECSGEIPAPDPSQVSASDNCSIPEVTFVGDESDGGTCPEVITRTYRVSDDCENEIIITQTITIGDIIPPTASDLPPITLSGCNMTVPGPDISLVTDAADNCSEPVVEFAGDNVSLNGCLETTERLYSVTDECNNSIVVTQIITRTVDLEPPVFLSVPDDLTIECNGEIPPIPDLEYTDNCGQGGIATGVETGPIGDPPVYTWTWSATDDCGNTTEITVTITVNDTPIETNLADVFCTGDEYTLPDGGITTEGGSYGPYVFTASTGCDSIVTLELTGLEPVTVNIADEICDGEEYTLPDGTIATEGGSFGPFTFSTSEGCDSIVFVELSVLDEVVNNINAEFCEEGEYILPDGSVTTTEGTYGPFVFISQNGCDSIVNVTLVEIPSPDVSISDPGPICSSGGIITLEANPPGGTWSGSVNTNQLDPSLLGTGLHQVIYTYDLEGCEGSDTISILIYELSILCEVLTDESSPGANDGSAIVNISGGIPPYSIQWEGPVSGTDMINGDSTYVIQNLSEGSYTVEVTDANGCVATCSFIIEGNFPCDVELKLLEIADASCGVNNGSILVQAFGGSIPYSYSIDGVAYGSSGLFPGLFGGQYSIYVLDGNGCADTIQAVVGSSDAPVINEIITTDPNCGASDGSITITASGGLGALLYSITGGSSFQASPVFNGLAAGTYTIVVIDEANCQVSGTAILQESGGPVIDEIAFTPTSCNESDGSITIQASGVPVLQYSITGVQFQTLNTFNGLPAGNYTVIVKDGNGCTASGVVSLNTLEGPEVPDIQVTHTHCGEDDGAIVITASGGSGDLEYFLNGDSYGDQHNIENLPAGNYLIEVVDENGCSAPGQAVINDSEGPGFDVYITPAHCGMADGVVEMDGTGGTPPYTYSINGGPFTANFTFVNRPSDDYILAVKDAKGCIYIKEVFLWEEEGPEIDDVLIVEPDCGLSNGRIEVIASSDNLEYSILTPPSFQSSAVFDPVPPGTYTIVIRDQFNCRDQASATIPDKPVPVIDLDVINSECGMSIGSITVNVSGGQPPYLYKLDQGAFAPLNIFNNLPAGNYTITVQGANGCEAKETATIGADGAQFGSITSSICDGTEYILHDHHFTAAGEYSITLSGGAMNGCDSIIALTLDVVPAATYFLDITICAEGAYVINGNAYTQPGEYLIDTVASSTGCDSITFLRLEVNEFNRSLIKATICEGDVYNVNGQEFSLPGEYLLDTIAGPDGCDTIISLQLTVNPNPQADAGIDQILNCEFNVVTLLGSAEGGSTKWTGPGIHSGNANLINPEVAQPGNYILTVSSQEGCIVSDTVLVELDPQTVISNAGPDAFLSCDIDSIILQASPIGSQYNYHWSGPGILPQQSHLINPIVTVPGNYSLVVTDTITKCVSQPDTLIITDITADVIAIVQDPNSLDCFSTFIDLNATGSSSGINLVYIWFNEQGDIIGHTPNLHVSSGGLFTFLVQDTISGCFDRDTVSVDDLTEYPPVDAGDPALLNCYNTHVVLNEGAVNNLPNLVFQWTGPENGIVGIDTVLSIVANEAGWYYLQATDTITGCSNSDSVLVNDESIDVVAEIEVVQSFTCTDSLALLNIGQSTIGPNLIHSWTGPGFNEVKAEQIVSGNAGEFILFVFDEQSGCKGADTIELVYPEPIIDLDAAIEEPYCAGDSSGKIMISEVTGGTPEYLFAINGLEPGHERSFENLAAGIYTIAIVDANGCTYSETITVPEGITFAIDIGIDIELDLGDSLILSAEINLPWTFVDSLVWTPEEILSCTHCEEPILYGLHDNVISATVFSGSCLATDSIKVRVDDDVSIYIPNVFSPNGDGVNDHVTVFTDPRVKRVVRFEIFDRWGNQVFVNEDFPPNDPLLGWDGVFKGKMMNPAVFAYWATVELLNGDQTSRKGDITLVR